MKHLILCTFLLTSYFVSFAQTKLLIDRKDGKKDSIAVNTISQIRFSSPGINEPSLLEVVTVLDSAKAKFIEYANLTKGDLMYSLDLTENWLMKQPNVKSTFSMGDGYIYITLKSGLKTTFYFNEVDDNGISVYRGGKAGSPIHAGSEFINNAEEILSKNVIENKKVLLFETTTDLDLEPQIPVITDILNKAGLDLKVTVLKYKQCTAEAVETFKDYGLVIIDGHGQISTFELGTYVDFTNKPKTEESVKNEIKTQLGSGSADKVSSGAIELAASIKANPQQSDWVKRIIKEDRYTTWLSGKYIATLPPMPKTIIFGNMCNSGWIIKYLTTPERKITLTDKSVVTYPAKTDTFEYAVGRTFIERGLISYYGFTRNEYLNRRNVVIPAGTSRGVPDDFSKKVEKIFVQRLAKDNDSTGIANLKPDNKTEYFDPDRRNIDLRLYGDLYFRHYGEKDYSYQKCGDTLTDARDGQKYATVCIGKQNWMAQNLNYDATGSACYNNIPGNCTIYGRLYDWNTVMQGASASDSDPSGVQGVCPKGWHVPSKAEWDKLIISLGGKDAAGFSLMSTTWGSGTNSSGFNVLPAGCFILPPNNFGLLGSTTLFATSSKDENGNMLEVGLNGTAKVTIGIGQGSSCRCVKNP